MANLSQHFTEAEFTRSEIAIRKGIDNSMPESLKPNAINLCEKVLEPLRAKLNEYFGHDIAIHITSGYRNEAVNKAIGGARNSQHMQAQAADIWVIGMTTEELFLWVKSNLLEYDQIIQEFDTWVHISWAGSNNRNMDLRATKTTEGKTVYTAT